MASSLVVVVKVVAVVVVLVTDVVVSSGISATFTQGVAAIWFQIDAKSKRSDWWRLSTTGERYQVGLNLKPLLSFPSKVILLQ